MIILGIYSFCGYHSFIKIKSLQRRGEDEEKSEACFPISAIFFDHIIPT